MGKTKKERGKYTPTQTRTPLQLLLPKGPHCRTQTASTHKPLTPCKLMSFQPTTPQPNQQQQTHTQKKKKTHDMQTHKACQPGICTHAQRWVLLTPPPPQPPRCLQVSCPNVGPGKEASLLGTASSSPHSTPQTPPTDCILLTHTRAGYHSGKMPAGSFHSSGHLRYCSQSPSCGPKK